MQGTRYPEYFCFKLAVWWVFSATRLSTPWGKLSERRRKQDSQWPGWIHLANLNTYCVTALSLKMNFSPSSCVLARCVMGHAAPMGTCSNEQVVFRELCAVWFCAGHVHNQDETLDKTSYRPDFNQIRLLTICEDQRARTALIKC